jgi:hypothetical protein
MAELLDSLLDFNRVGAGGKLQLDVRPVDLVDVCRQEVELQRSAHSKARIEFEAPSSCPGLWDASRMRQAIDVRKHIHVAGLVHHHCFLCRSFQSRGVAVDVADVVRDQWSR